MGTIYLLEAVRRHCPDSRMVMVGSRLSVDPAKARPRFLIHTALAKPLPVGPRGLAQHV